MYMYMCANIYVNWAFTNFNLHVKLQIKSPRHISKTQMYDISPIGSCVTLAIVYPLFSFDVVEYDKARINI